MDYNEIIEKARELNIKGDYEEAIKLLKKIKKEGEDDIVWNYIYSCALIRTNKFKRAFDILKSAVANIEADFPYAHLNLGMLYYWRGKLLDAFKIVEEGLEKCKKYQPEYTWEFQETLKAIYLLYPFVNKEHPERSVLRQEFLAYDENADSKYKIKRVEKAKKDLAFYLGDYERERLNCCLYISGRILPQFSYNYAELLAPEIAIGRLGIFTGSDILVDKNNNRPFACKMNFQIYGDTEKSKKKFVDLVNKLLFFPKGSYIQFIYNNKKEEKINIGEYDVLALGIDTRGLPEEIIQKYNGGKLIERIRLECSSKEIDGGYYFNYDETPERLWVRFLGINYSEMEKVIKKSIKNYPLCKDTVIINETNLNKKEQKETNEIEENIFIN